MNEFHLKKQLLTEDEERQKNLTLEEKYKDTVVDLVTIKNIKVDLKKEKKILKKKYFRLNLLSGFRDLLIFLSGTSAVFYTLYYFLSDKDLFLNLSKLFTVQIYKVYNLAPYLPNVNQAKIEEMQPVMPNNFNDLYFIGLLYLITLLIAFFFYLIYHNKTLSHKIAKLLNIELHCKSLSEKEKWQQLEKDQLSQNNIYLKLMFNKKIFEVKSLSKLIKKINPDLFLKHKK